MLWSVHGENLDDIEAVARKIFVVDCYRLVLCARDGEWTLLPKPGVARHLFVSTDHSRLCVLTASVGKIVFKQIVYVKK
eukprot:SAG11_NODE_8508_length_1008_cov_0.930693_1_plen_79_part_00